MYPLCVFPWVENKCLCNWKTAILSKLHGVITRYYRSTFMSENGQIKLIRGSHSSLYSNLHPSFYHLNNRMGPDQTCELCLIMIRLSCSFRLRSHYGILPPLVNWQSQKATATDLKDPSRIFANMELENDNSIPSFRVLFHKQPISKSSKGGGWWQWLQSMDRGLVTQRWQVC